MFFMIFTEKLKSRKIKILGIQPFLMFIDEKLADEEMSGDHDRCIGELEMQK